MADLPLELLVTFCVGKFCICARPWARSTCFCCARL